jgi:hypothetical protein
MINKLTQTLSVEAKYLRSISGSVKYTFAK